MSIRSWLHNKTRSKTTLTDEDRAASISQRKITYALRQKEKEVALMERISKIEHLTNPKESAMDSMMKQALPILLAKIANEKNITPQTTEIPKVLNSSDNYTDEKIEILVQNNPKLLKHATKFSDDEVRKFLIEQDKTITKESADKIIKRIRQ